jgi:hypothetical protein
MASNKLLLAGIIGSVGVAVVLASLLLSAQYATAQMEHQQHQQMQQQESTQHPGKKHSMFSANGMSVVQDVRISGIAITGDNEVSINLFYSGTGSSPSVTIIAMTNHSQMMGGMGSDSGHGGGMMDSGMTGSQHSQQGGMDMTMMGNSTSMTMPHGAQSVMMETQTGSALVQSGWQTGSAFTIRLDGTSSAYDASDVHVMVFPHLT